MAVAQDGANDLHEIDPRFDPGVDQLIGARPVSCDQFIQLLLRTILQDGVETGSETPGDSIRGLVVTDHIHHSEPRLVGLRQ